MGQGYFLREELSSDEIRQRVSVLKRLRELLREQRDRFRSYLEVLDKEKDAIERDNSEDLNGYVDLEEKIAADVFAIRRVIDPLEEIYRAGREKNQVPGLRSPDDEVAGLKKSLEALRTEAVARSERNRELLARRMAEIRSEIQSLRGNPYLRRPAFAAAAAPSLVDMEG
jgi:chromosome segregation ATPase